MYGGVQPELQSSDDVQFSKKNSIEQECVQDCSWLSAQSRATVLAIGKRHEQNPTHTKTSSSQNGDLIKRMRKQCAPGVLFLRPSPRTSGYEARILHAETIAILSACDAQ